MPLKKYNWALVILPFLIFSCGFMSLLSTFPEKARAQFVFFITGSVLYVGISFLDYRLLKPYWKGFYFVTLGLLVLTKVLGEVRLGSARWLNLGGIVFQPSELAKIALILLLASFLSEDLSILNNLKKVFTLCLHVLPLGFLVLVQPDLGTSLILFGVFAFVLFYAGFKKLYFLVVFLILGALSSPVWNLLHNYQKRRVLVFLNPSLDALGSGYNVAQALIALGSGGVLGSGFGKGTQAKLNFLPAFWTDFIFASFGEEWGFLGVALLLLFIFLLCLSILHVIYRKQELFGTLLCVGIFGTFFLQAVINIGMNISLLPVTGIPLPLMSYGGSSLIVSMVLLGLVQSVWLYGSKKI